jgi:hypothetical protein
MHFDLSFSTHEDVVIAQLLTSMQMTDHPYTAMKIVLKLEQVISKMTIVHK